MQLLFSAREIIVTLVKYKCKTFIKLTPEVDTSLIHRENHYSADLCEQNQFIYLLHGDSSMDSAK